MLYNLLSPTAEQLHTFALIISVCIFGFKINYNINQVWYNLNKYNWCNDILKQ